MIPLSLYKRERRKRRANARKITTAAAMIQRHLQFALVTVRPPDGLTRAGKGGVHVLILTFSAGTSQERP
jgi:hypothetical protein